MNKSEHVNAPRRHSDPQAQILANRLIYHDVYYRSLPAIQNTAALDCLVKQLLDSIRRVSFVQRLAKLNTHSNYADPNNERFDPLRAAVLQASRGDLDDAIWLVFLAVHFGKHSKDGWALSRTVYGRVGEAGLWNWQNVSCDVKGFQLWLEAQNEVLRRFRFSNHRQYESLNGQSTRGTGSAVESFISWILAAGSFGALTRAVHTRVGQNPKEVFDALYRQMQVVRRFGRLGKFDFLTMLGKLEVAPITPGSAYIWDNASGPYRGICLLATGKYNGPLTRKHADQLYVELGQTLEIGMQELEDALCNWQKNPTAYKFFRG